MTDWTSTFAIRSAAWTAWRIAPSAASRSTMTPPLSPCERWWPMPMMRAKWVRPRRVVSASAGCSSAMRQTTLLVPMSSTESVVLRRAESGFRRGVRPCGSACGLPGGAVKAEVGGARCAGRIVRLMCWSPWPSALLLGLGAGRGRFLGEANHDPVGHAQVDRDDVLLQDAVVALELDQTGQGFGGAGLGQADVDAVELQGPAPAGDVGAGLDALGEGAGRLDQAEIVLELAGWRRRRPRGAARRSGRRASRRSRCRRRRSRRSRRCAATGRRARARPG